MMENIALANEELNKWCGTENINYYEGDTALGFLFKYAVPELDRREIAYSLHSGRHVINNTLVHHAECWYWNSETVKRMEKAGLKTRFGITDEDIAVAFHHVIYKAFGGKE